MQRSIFALILILAIVLCVSCAGNDGNIVTPGTDYEGAVAGPDVSTLCLGAWRIVASKDTGGVEIEPLRAGDGIINVLGFLEPPALSGMTIDFDSLFIDFDEGELSVDVILKHPIPDPVFMGFDVRGIVIGFMESKADPDLMESKADPDLMWSGPGGPRLLNNDGYTRWWNPSEFSDPGLYGFTEGTFGTKNTDIVLIDLADD